MAVIRTPGVQGEKIFRKVSSSLVVRQSTRQLGDSLIF